MEYDIIPQHLSFVELYDLRYSSTVPQYSRRYSPPLQLLRAGGATATAAAVLLLLLLLPLDLRDQVAKIPLAVIGCDMALISAGVVTKKSWSAKQSHSCA
jgi:hypothetical protein